MKIVSCRFPPQARWNLTLFSHSWETLKKRNYEWSVKFRFCQTPNGNELTIFWAAVGPRTRCRPCCLSCCRRAVWKQNIGKNKTKRNNSNNSITHCHFFLFWTKQFLSWKFFLYELFVSLWMRIETSSWERCFLFLFSAEWKACLFFSISKPNNLSVHWSAPLILGTRRPAKHRVVKNCWFGIYFVGVMVLVFGFEYS